MSEDLSRRERQIMDIVFREGESSARQIWNALSDQPTYGSLRKQLQILVSKGHLKQRPDGRSLLYSSVESQTKAAKSATARLLDTFYRGSIEEAVGGLLNLNEQNVSTEELDRIAELIAEARKEKPSK